MRALVKENDETKQELTKALQNQYEILEELIKVRTELNEANEFIVAIEEVMLMLEDEGDYIIN